MSSLIHKKSQITLASSILKASSLWKRTKGLLGERSFPEKQVLWLIPCSSIHTFFMRFPIDVIFVDKNLKITSLAYSVPSFRILFGGYGCYSTFEMKANQLKKYQLNKGDELYVEY